MLVRGRILSCLLVPIFVSACGNDFDALFKNGADASTTDAARPGDGGAEGGSECTSASCACRSGSVCNGSCDNDGTCTASADNANLTYACKEHANACVVTCNGTSRCDVKCDAEESCSMKCDEKASCTLRCTERPRSCSLDCDEGEKKDCGGGVFTCRASCP